MPKHIGLHNGIEAVKNEIQQQLSNSERSVLSIARELEIPEPSLNRFKKHGTGISPEKLDVLVSYFGYSLRVEIVKKK